jgi:dTDP-4-amino-4,6-dideoxygalactose transaminase
MESIIPFNKPYLTGKETTCILEAINMGKISGNGFFTKKCQNFFEEKYHFKKCLLTTSCTDALEMAAILSGIKEGDEVIIPSYTFVSTALAFVRLGAKIIFADSETLTPNIDVTKLEALITQKTKVIVPVHYAGVACDMEAIMNLAKKYSLIVIEDAAQSIDSFYNGKALGSIGHMSAFSFHETKNIISGEGGMLAINDERFLDRAEIIWEKGTNRASFFRGEVNKYGWVDTGSSFLPSEIIAAFLWAQLEKLDEIQSQRKRIWDTYYNGLKNWAQDKKIKLPIVPSYATNNGHMFYIVCNSLEQRSKIIKKLKDNQILAVFHYLSLHSSPYYQDKYEGNELVNSDRYTNCLLRLPFYFELTNDQLNSIIQILISVD